MQKVVSNFIYPLDGKRLTENGKDCGVLVIAPESKDLTVFGNVKEIVKKVEYLPDMEKVFKHKTTGELKHTLEESELADYEEVEDEEMKQRLAEIENK